MKKTTFIDLFSGAGGFLRGFIEAGFTPLLSVEFWKPAIETHKLNYPTVPIWTEDIRTISNEKLLNFIGKVDVIIGGPRAKDSPLLENVLSRTRETNSFSIY